MARIVTSTGLQAMPAGSGASGDAGTCHSQKDLQSDDSERRAVRDARRAEIIRA
jgi:hypothetical protein